MKRQKIRNDIRREAMTVAAGGARDTRIDLILNRYGLAQNETALKHICRTASADHKYW
jgi:hypothetical protein